MFPSSAAFANLSRDMDPRIISRRARGCPGLLSAPALSPAGRGDYLYLHGPDMAQRFFHAPDDVLSHADGWNTILGSTFGQGLLNMDGGRHHAYRQAVMPMLSRRVSDGYTPLVTAAFYRTAARLHGKMDLFPVVRALVFEISAQIFAGVTPQTAAELLEAYIALQAPRPLGTAEGIRAMHRVVAARNTLRAVLLDAVRRSTDCRDDAVTRLRSLADPPTDQQVAENLAILLLGGYETTGYLISRLLWLLAVHPGLQERLRRELEAEDPTAGRSLLDEVFQETARLHPPLAHLPRRVLADLDWAGHHIPAGSQVFFSVIATQHNPEVFCEPERFRLRRTDTGSTPTAGRPFGTLPFGAGRRICPGIHLATLEAKLITEHFLRTFHLHTDDGEDVADVTHNGASLAPAAPLTVTLEPRRGLAS